MGASRSTDATKVKAAEPVAERTITSVPEAAVFVRGLEARGYTATAKGTDIVTTAPDEVFSAMADEFRARRAPKGKK